MNRCRYHNVAMVRSEHSVDPECPLCMRDDLKVVTCEVDKIRRVLDSMSQDGRAMHPHSFAVLVFQRDRLVMGKYSDQKTERGGA